MLHGKVYEVWFPFFRRAFIDKFDGDEPMGASVRRLSNAEKRYTNPRP